MAQFAHIAALASALAAAHTLAQPADPQGGLTAVEAAAGWKDYSGADATSLWRGYRQPAFPAQGWSASGGELRVSAGGGDIVTVDQFGDFEFMCRFLLAPKANSGIMYRVTDKHETPWQTGPEFQVLEDATAGVGATDAHSSGAMYDLYTPAAGKTMNPAGEWNDARVRLRGGVIQHWINGAKVVEARIFDDAGRPTPEWQERIAASKFKVYDGFGLQPRGSIALQDHGDQVSFANIKIRDLDAPTPGEVFLFNGRNMEGWTAILPDGGKMSDVWSVVDGVVVCKGQPTGYIRTNESYENFILRLEWRWSPVTKNAGNSGVLFRCIGEAKVWPTCIEAQLQSGSAGDFIAIGDYPMTTDATRKQGRRTAAAHATERPVGEWNQYEIIVNGGDVTLLVNGEEVNRATDAKRGAGPIALQSEGTEIHFRNVRLAPLP